MTEKLETVLDKVSSIANPVNSLLLQEFYQYMVDNRKSDSYKKNNLKALVLFSHELAPNITFYNIQKKEQILEFLNKRIKPRSDDPDEKWITTWNDYLGRLKFFFRWLYNYKIKKDEAIILIWFRLPIYFVRNNINKVDVPLHQVQEC